MPSWRGAPDGAGTLEVEATDLAGNVTTVLGHATVVLDGTPPEAPSTVLVTARSQGRLRIQWQSPPSAAGETLTYTLYRAADADGRQISLLGQGDPPVKRPKK